MSREEPREEVEIGDLIDRLRDLASDTIAPLQLLNVLFDCIEERIRQDEEWGDQSGHHLGGWFAVLAEDSGGVAKEVCKLTFTLDKETRAEIGPKLRIEAVCATFIEAVCAAFIEARDRQGWTNWPHETHLIHEKEDNT